MTYNNYLPPEEEKLTGIYRVSFEIQLGSQDDLALSDVAQALTEGFGKGFGEDFVTSKVAELSVEKITKKAVKVLKVGDIVLLKEPVKITANIYSDDGYIFTGNRNEISEVVGENVELNIEAGSMGFVNRITNGIIEVADLDRPVEDINIDLISVKAEQLEKIDLEEVK
jgi:hypothetical protein